MRRSTRLAALTASVALTALVASGCASTAESPKGDAASDKTTITIGFNPGPYLEMFTEGIEPILEKDGYTVETKDFTDGVIVNVALSQGEIDANIMQHPVYLEAINAQEGLSNAALVQVPGPPMALFGGKKSALDDVANGSTVAVPNQPSNQYRALKVVEAVGWITLSDDIDPATASLADVVDNPHDLQFVEMENAQQVAALSDVDYSVIQGNFVVSGGLKLTDALELEDLTDDFSVVVAVDEKNLDADWAKALKAAYESDEFAEYISSNSQYDGYNLPAALER
ncbi:MetQ/NlpA family ABC transporter substrate-binding protein [Microbacterium sp. XT11]|uniref:MetQ/NlpA family ABC transporter substrate-binding protein n=1 Tax=Microbacterium sp. XT11 TaxID=367477 RepID=UPI000742EE85|nr:MetQ/NlpA family ABC transporter substrate-binding protein [Microbacterium sp. XT11]ALX66580.1 methionine-binding protein [Microbacterium sp. XT11]